MKKVLRKWREGEGEEGLYNQEKKEYRMLCERKKREQKERWEKEVEKIKTESQVWEFVNRGRKRRVRVSEEIKI